MNEKVRDEINNAFNFLSALPVSGDGVDVMYLVRSCLRRAMKAMEEENQENPEAVKDGG